MEDKKYPKISEKDQLRKANHVYFEQVAETLNDCGIWQSILLDKLKSVKMRNTKDSIKDIYRSMGQQKFGIKSTQELTTIQAKELEEDFTQAIQESFGITLPEFPSQESLYNKQQGFKRLEDYNQK
jgi:hypothetical protein